MSAVDYSFSRFTVAQLKAAGVTVVGRYLTGSGKAISAAELAADLMGGLSVFLVFEVSATDASNGFASGADHARQANAALVALGLPVSTPVYFAADTAYPTPATAVPYYQGIASVRAAGTNGCYGEAALFNLLFADGLIGYGWESESTSFPGNGALSPNAAIWQKVNGAPLPGTDANIIEKADFGQLPRPAAPAPPAPLPPPPPPIHYPGDKVTAYSIQVLIANGAGWYPIAPAWAGKVETVELEDTNPQDGATANLPTYVGFSGQAGPQSPHGTLNFKGGANGTYGALVWVAD